MEIMVEHCQACEGFCWDPKLPRPELCQRAMVKLDEWYFGGGWVYGWIEENLK